MDRETLNAALVAAGIPGGYYRIEGVHEPAPTPPDFLFLRRAADGGWETGAHERGQDDVLARHPDESTACAHLLRLLV
ncbi:MULTISPECIES: hypothetical protein [unclassified Streptomyces]|uniref:hypothetical protein n=1 Tax=unclassified Streptomyces TaxID=2593676 RepID=UPI001371DA12|nr:hypothetical protein [Streptomyces sp. YIM 132580]NYS21169.1 hypothetical protein [Streptomyces sp. SJ1-7]